MADAAPKGNNAHQETESKLLKDVEHAHHELLNTPTSAQDETVRLRLMHALKAFTDYIFHGKLPSR